MDTATLMHSLMLSNVVITKNCEGITHQDSLVQPEGGAHNFNWVLGHLVRTRNDILEVIGKNSLYAKSEFEVYSPHGFSPDSAHPLDKLLSSFHALQNELEAGIKSLSAEKLQRRTSLGQDQAQETVGTLLATVLWHEAYHAGQLGVLRRAVGKPGVIKNPEGE